MPHSITTIRTIFINLTEFFSEKVFGAVIVPLLGLMFGFDSSKIITALIFLVVFDFITGICSAKISGEPIKSKSVVRSAYKLAVYGLLVSAGHLTEQITPFSTYIEEAVTTFLALTELISIIENIGKMGFAVPRKLLNQLHRLREEDTITT